MVKKSIVVILMIMLAVTQIECITQSYEFEPNKLSPTLCEARCDITCVKHIQHYLHCIKACARACYGVPPSIKAKH
jgi:hypothetical protein